MKPEFQIIGYLVHLPNGKMGCVGPCCKRYFTSNDGSFSGLPLYRINIGDYKQHCCACTVLLVEGKTSEWCELFPERFEEGEFGIAYTKDGSSIGEVIGWKKDANGKDLVWKSFSKALEMNDLGGWTGYVRQYFPLKKK